VEAAAVKVLLITGLLAQESVEHYAEQSQIETKVMVLNVPVAAFLTPQTISQSLKQAKVNDFDLILVPGLVRGDASVIFKATGIPTFKGPIYAADLPTVLEMLGKVQLSTVVPACELLRDKLQKKALEEISKAEENKDVLLKEPGNMAIKNLAFGKDFPMRVLAEIVDAALLSNRAIQRLAKKYVALGADVIDVGMVAGESRPKDAKRIVAAVKDVVSVPVSIDSLDPEEIKAAVSAGADLVLSVDAGNVEAIAPFLNNVAVVAIPSNQREGYFPKKLEARVQLLEQVIAKAKSLGIENVLADLILDPLDVLGSFFAFRQFAQRNPDVPLFVGVSNVTELMDADSVGINALLARLCSEIGASMILATQKSDKTQGSIKEEVAASKMMFLAKKRGSVPKDLGVNMLILKDKRNREEKYNKQLEESTRVLSVKDNGASAEIDKQGSFRIFIDREKQSIIVLHFMLSDLEVPALIVKGKTAEGIYRKIVNLGLISKMDHAAYLGSELTKAEIALRTGKEYIQDKPMFKE
jgi:dihydropteroate synthase-like protein